VVLDGTMVTTVRTHTVTGSFQLAQLTEEMNHFCETENYGTEYQLAGMSADEKRASIRIQSGRRNPGRRNTKAGPRIRSSDNMARGGVGLDQ
jgi:hypothetical protein